MTSAGFNSSGYPCPECGIVDEYFDFTHVQKWGRQRVWFRICSKKCRWLEVFGEEECPYPQHQ